MSNIAIRPTSINAPSTRARMPSPVTDCTSTACAITDERTSAARTIARASGCFDCRSTAAATESRVGFACVHRGRRRR